LQQGNRGGSQSARWVGRGGAVGGSFEGRRLWEIGSWGNASDHIGQRWESLGYSALNDRLRSANADVVVDPGAVLICLVDDEQVQRRIQGLGLTNPDALLAEPAGSIVRLRPVDFKWSVETATYRQISAAALRALLEHFDSPLRSFVAASLGREGDSLEVEAGDGFFFSPDSRPNRAFLDSEQNRRQEYPLEADDVVFETVLGRTFFGGLPWWPQAEFLATLDRATANLDDVDRADRYYRFGSGLGGALVKMRTPIFAVAPAAIDVFAESADLLARRQFRTSEEIIQHLRGLMADRDERVRRLKELTRSPYGYGEMMSDLASVGVAVPDRADGPSAKAVREHWGAVHKLIGAEHRGAIQKAGMALLAEGQSEAGALDILFLRRDEFVEASRRFAQATLRRELAAYRR
jgi:hypothetical protein